MTAPGAIWGAGVGGVAAAKACGAGKAEAGDARTISKGLLFCKSAVSMMCWCRDGCWAVGTVAGSATRG
eukprot:10573666-Alexandrium_andersonii.AAC.1